MAVIGKSRVVLVVLFMLFVTAACLADGMILLPKDVALKGFTVSQNVQRAAIVWDDGIETLHLKSNYTGPAENLAWVVPVPARPNVERSTWAVFEEAEKATRPQVTLTELVPSKKGFGCGCAASMDTPASESVDLGVTKLESLNIRELHVDILSATHGAGLLQWLKNNEYAVPEEANHLLQSYIDKGSYFVAVKIAKNSIWSSIKGTNYEVSTGLTPLAITFESSQPYFPLEISRLTSAPESEILLLTICPHRMVPKNYEAVELSRNDIKEGVGAELYERGRRKKLDLGPAVRAAQNRCGRGSFVVESAVLMSYDENRIASDSTILIPYHVSSTGRTVWVTRFHTFLGRKDMRDVYFVVAKNDVPLPGHFHFWKEDLYSMRFPAGLATAGLVFLAVPVNNRRRKVVRGTALAFLLLAMCVM